MSCGGTELSYAFRTCCSAFSQIWAKMCFKPDFRFEFEMFGQSSGVVFLLGFQNASALTSGILIPAKKNWYHSLGQFFCGRSGYHLCLNVMCCSVHAFEPTPPLWPSK